MANPFYSINLKKDDYMRAIDAKILEELEMLYGDRDCFASLHDGLEKQKFTGTN